MKKYYIKRRQRRLGGWAVMCPCCDKPIANGMRKEVAEAYCALQNSDALQRQIDKEFKKGICYDPEGITERIVEAYYRTGRFPV